MSRNLKWGGIVLVIFFVNGFVAIANSNDTGSSTPSPTIQAQLSKEQEATIPDMFLTHEQLLSLAQADSKNIIGETFEMDLYLEQQPTNISAEFITQTDKDDMNTILITCNMNPDDLKKLDGASAQKGIYTKTYKAEVAFKEFDNSAGPYFKADCNLKQ
jgi:hypothetical protein